MESWFCFYSASKTFSRVGDISKVYVKSFPVAQRMFLSKRDLQWYFSTELFFIHIDFYTQQHFSCIFKSCKMSNSVQCCLPSFTSGFLLFRSKRGAHRQTEILCTGKLFKVFNDRSDRDIHFFCLNITFITFSVWNDL